MLQSKSFFYGLKWLLCLFFVGMMVACHYPSPDYSHWDMNEETKDSLRFSREHHYSQNYNFKVYGDSVILVKRLEENNRSSDTLAVYNNEGIVVADIRILPQDSIDSVWVKVAKDQYTMGWTREKDLLPQVVPVDPISQFIHLFSESHTYLFLFIIIAAFFFYIYRAKRHKKIKIPYYNDVDSWYPMLLCLLVSGCAVLYGSIQNFVPETWREFYFHPTLNPFQLPFLLGCFIVGFWMILVVLVTTVDQVLRKEEDFIMAVTYLFGLAVACVLCYTFFSLATISYLGYPCWLAYVVFSLWRYRVHRFVRYQCGNCGREIPSKGECPYCGAINE